MLNCVLVEQDPACLNLVKHYIEHISELNLVQSCSNSSAAASYIHKNISTTDLVFLDVEMPDLSSIELMTPFKDFPSVILISSKEKCAIETFEQKALQYLLKPLEYGKFLKAVEPLFLRPAPTRINVDCIYAKENGVMTKINHDDILYFETLGDYVKIHTKNKVHVVNSSMRSIEDKLGHSNLFVRIHRSYYINTHYLESFDSDTAIVSNRPIPIGSKYRPELQSKLVII